MKWIDILQQSLSNLLRRKLRSVLTMLGVIIGTAAIIVTISLGYGAEQAQMDALQSTTNLRLLNVYPYYDSGSGDYTATRVTKITDTVARDLRRLDGVEAVTPLANLYLNASLKLITGKYTDGYISLLAVYPEDFLKIAELKSGHGFTASTDKMEFVLSEMQLAQFFEAEKQEYSDVDVWGLLYAGEELPLLPLDWLNEKWTLNLTWYDYEHADEVTGEVPETTLQYKGTMVGTLAADLYDNYFSNAAIVNINWAKKWIRANRSLFKELGLTDLDSYSSVLVKAESVEVVEELVKQIKNMGLQTDSPMEYIATYKEQIRTTQAFLGFIGAISMFVAALSIANTMMMSIYERTREIGVMKVLGCRMSNIRGMFLCEAGYIGIFGGAAGLAASYALSYALNNVEWLRNLVSSVMSSSSVTGATVSTISIIPMQLALTTWLGVIAVSLLSGFYPAQRAMQLSSLAAIRNSD